MELAEQTIIDLINFIKEVAPHVWDLAVRQQIIVGGMFTVLGIVALIAGPLLTRRFLKYEDKSQEGGWLAAAVVTTIFMIIFVLAAIYQLPSLLNPEYAAMMDILGRVTGN